MRGISKSCYKIHGGDNIIFQKIFSVKVAEEVRQSFAHWYISPYVLAHVKVCMQFPRKTNYTHFKEDASFAHVPSKWSEYQHPMQTSR